MSELEKQLVRMSKILMDMAVTVNNINNIYRAEYKRLRDELKSKNICSECGAYIEDFMKEEIGDTDICYRCYQIEEVERIYEQKHPDE